MSAHALLKRFDIVADQISNIPALRRLVVDLAVRNKLLPTEANDMNALEMLNRISSKIDALVLAGVIKKQKPLPSISDQEVPVKYLAHCTFARLGNIANLQKGLTGIQSAQPGDHPLVLTAAERGTCDHFDFDGAAAIIPLVSSTGHGHASINRLHYQEGKFALGSILCAVFPFDEQLISARFLFEYLTAFKEELLVAKMIGTANVTLTLGKIAEVPVPILAPAVQKCVDELMALCDQLEAAQQERERCRDRLAAASLQRLNQTAADVAPQAQHEHARFHLNHLPRLITRTEQVKAMRQLLLNLAVRGKLVEQDAGDEPAALLLKQIEAEIARLVKSGEMRKPKPLPSIEVEDEPFHVPHGWTWVRIRQITSDRGQTTPSNEFTYIDVGSINNEAGSLGEHKILSASDAPSRARKVVAKGDVLYSCVRPTLLNIAVVESEIIPTPIASTAFAVLNSFGLVLPRYLWIVLRSPYLEAIVEAGMRGQAYPAINDAEFALLPLALPPLAEQHRIVAKVDELMALCDQLEAQLATTQSDSRCLLEAVLEAASV